MYTIHKLREGDQPLKLFLENYLEIMPHEALYPKEEAVDDLREYQRQLSLELKDYIRNQFDGINLSG